MGLNLNIWHHLTTIHPDYVDQIFDIYLIGEGVTPDIRRRINKYIEWSKENNSFDNRIRVDDDRGNSHNIYDENHTKCPNGHHNGV